jgi:hypothetical protein
MAKWYEEKLLACPYYGCQQVQICRTNAQACWVSCENCGAESESNKDRRVALLNWNRRVREELPAEVVEDGDKEFWDRRDKRGCLKGEGT